MAAEIIVPTFPESVADGTILAWRKQPGEAVSRGEIVADIETDKVVFEVPASQDGVLTEITAPAGTTVTSGQVIGKLGAATGAKTEIKAVPKAEPKVAVAQAGAPTMPSARKAAAESGMKTDDIAGSGRGGRILKEDVVRHLDVVGAKPAPAASPTASAKVVDAKPMSVPMRVPVPAALDGRSEKRVPMTRLRARIAERLVEAQSTAAILTTFNEVNMQPVMELRKRYAEKFEKEHGVKLGFMSFFVKAAIEALKRHPEVNASIDGNDIVYHGFYDIGIAVSSPRGLVVPIVRDADRLSMAEIETTIKELGERAKTGKLTIEELTGGTFTLTNGGIFGSLVSTPILNPPQSAILGMHKIQERPVAENGQVVIRPMMYLALSYDHRLIDGREAVLSLVAMKEVLEDPARLLLGI